MTNFFIKDPSATLDYKFDWKGLSNGALDATSNWLKDDEVITSFTLIAGSGLNIEDSYLSDNSTSVTAWVSGGIPYQEYDLICRISTNSNPVARVDERTIKIKIMNR